MIYISATKSFTVFEMEADSRNDTASYNPHQYEQSITSPSKGLYKRKRIYLQY